MPFCATAVSKSANAITSVSPDQPGAAPGRASSGLTPRPLAIGTPQARQIKHLRALCAVAATGSTVGAAQLLNVSQSSVTRAIQEGEAGLQTHLFHRLGRGMQLTEPGTILARRAGRALAYLAQVDHSEAKWGGAPATRWAGSRFSLGIGQRHMAVLLSLATTASQTNTARELGVSQPAVQQALAQLEHLSGKPLFLRTRSGLRLTEGGELALKAVKLAYAELAQAEEEMVLQQGATQGRLVIGTLPFSTVLLLPEAVDQVQQAHPGLSLTIVDGTYDALVHQLRHADIDMMLGALRTKPPGADLTQEALFVDGLAVVARATHPLAGRRALRWDELRNQPWIMPMPNTPAEVAFDQTLHEAGVTSPPSPLRVNSALMMQALLAQSDRLAMMSPRQIERELKAGLLVVLDVPVRHEPRVVGVMTRADYLPSPGAQKMLDAFRSLGRKMGDEASVHKQIA